MNVSVLHSPFRHFCCKIQFIAMSLTLLLATFTCSSWAKAAALHHHFRKELQAPDCTQLGQRMRSPHWLSVPNSRLVVNPTFQAQGGSDDVTNGFSAGISLDVAAYFGETPIQLPNFCSWESLNQKVVEGQNLDLAPSAWNVDNLKTNLTGEDAQLSSTANFGDMNQQVTVNLDLTPRLLIQVPECKGGWALKVNDGTQPVDAYLIGDNSLTGEFTADIRKATGWKGVKTFTVKVFAIGDPTQTVTISRIQFFGSRESAQIKPESSTWFPSSIVTEAGAIDGSISFEEKTLFLDKNTIGEQLKIKQDSLGALLLTGQFHAGAVHWDEAHQTLDMTGDGFHGTVVFNHPARWMGTRTSILSRWRHSSVQDSQSGDWGLELLDVNPGDRILLAARFEAGSSISSSSLTALRNLITAQNFAAALSRSERSWNALLASVPRPQGFALHGIAPLGVSSSQIRRMYYRAWVFLFSDILPPMPENNYPYPQLATGKPALWDGGSPHARPSAQWDSMVAIQMMAWVKPQTAWKAFEGMMSLVSPDGSMLGEGLPAVHAQTAWILYSLTHNAAQLRLLYPAIKRLLLWKAANPHWIFHSPVESPSKDSEFVVSALLDMGFARKIAQALNLPEEAAFWDLRAAELDKQYLTWFWKRPDGHPYWLYNTADGSYSGREGTWSLTGLALSPRLLPAPQRDSLLRFYEEVKRPDLPFLVPVLSRYTDARLVIRGLWRYGHKTGAVDMAETALRDIARAGEFSEVYTQDANPLPSGVQPSVFGACHFIDATLWLNGLDICNGSPASVKAPYAAGVENLHILNRTINLHP